MADVTICSNLLWRDQMATLLPKGGVHMGSAATSLASVASAGPYFPLCYCRNRAQLLV
jgi:hypothetical protein